jgi:hypothetical protein
MSSKTVLLPNNDSGTIILLVKRLLNKCFVITESCINLVANKQLPIIQYDQNSIRSNIHFKLDEDDNSLSLKASHNPKDGFYEFECSLVIKKFKIRYLTNKNDRPDSNVCSRFSLIQKNIDKITDLVEDIAFVSKKIEEDDSIYMSNTANVHLDVYHRTIGLCNILKFEKYIKTLNTVDLKHQYKLYQFLENNLERNVNYRFHGFSFMNNKKLITIKFLGILIFLGLPKQGDNIYKYFRHRGLSFLANYLMQTGNVNNFEAYIHNQSLKSQIL